MSRAWDVFCKVIDNYGDAAVCWRLARQLAAEHGARVRLWLDGLEVLHALCPEVVRDRSAQSVAGVEIRHWIPGADFGGPADICVDAFGGGLPDPYVAAMAQRNPAPLWIILEYLSAEPWVGAHHGLPSPHPHLPLARHFFFPGFVPGTGGVLKEAGLDARRDAFQGDPGRQAGLWRDLGFEPPGRAAIAVSLFGYENRGAAELLQAWKEGRRQVVVAVPRSSLSRQVSGFFGADADDRSILTSGHLEVRFLPFLPQSRYDDLLWACDWNFVRGEDSFVRAQWAVRPFVWHIYPQQERAHRVKLDAFLELYCEGLQPPPEAALRALWHGWNEPAGPSGPMRAAWKTLEGHQDALRAHARAWAARLALPGDLAANLAHFCEERLK
jgi:uncharacterized repeat protein (TIGR03837 family)